ncbi:hypothetical protein AGMMS49940_05800 [Spirochaetia bacterium]|nr:hypothetical protein AGMMS49940_05800 [Spirochaetia bacterium]
MVTKHDVLVISILALVFIGAGLFIGYTLSGWARGSDKGAGEFAGRQQRSVEFEQGLAEGIASGNAERERLEEYLRNAGDISERINQRAIGNATNIYTAIEQLQGIQKEVRNLEIWNNRVRRDYPDLWGDSNNTDSPVN